MGLASAVSGKDDSADSPAAVVSIRASPVSVDDAAKRLLCAVKASDVDAIADALRLAHHACEQEYEAHACEQEYEAQGADDDQ